MSDSSSEHDAENSASLKNDKSSTSSVSFKNTSYTLNNTLGDTNKKSITIENSSKNDQQQTKKSSSENTNKNNKIFLIQSSPVQQMTIQDVFDPSDATVHFNPNHNNMILGKAKPLNIHDTKKHDMTSAFSNLTNFKSNNYNFFSNNILKSRQDPTATGLNINTNANGFLDLVKSFNYKNGTVAAASKLKNGFTDKYMDYKRRWNEVLKREKRIFLAKYTSNTRTNTCKLDDFELKNTLGSGSFGRVILVKHKESGKFYALKILEKRNIIKSRQIEHTICEKKIMSAVSFPFLVSYFSSFKDNSNLYIALEYAPGGEMFKYLVKLNRFSENLCKFYSAQVVLAIEYLHSLDIIHRDLKPENTL
jgi:hypothetical protein